MLLNLLTKPNKPFLTNNLKEIIKFNFNILLCINYKLR